jgi:hypothetical protein
MGHDSSVGIVSRHQAVYPCINFVRSTLVTSEHLNTLYCDGMKRYFSYFCIKITLIGLESNDLRQGRGRGGGRVGSSSLFLGRNTRVPAAGYFTDELISFRICRFYN